MKKIKSYISRKSNKRRQIDALTKRVSDLQQALDLKNVEDSSSSQFCCKVCMEETHVPMLNSICGHTYCNNCWSQFPNKSCPTCRQNIGELIVNWELVSNETDQDELKKIHPSGDSSGYFSGILDYIPYLWNRNNENTSH